MKAIVLMLIILTANNLSAIEDSNLAEIKLGLKEIKAELQKQELSGKNNLQKNRLLEADFSTFHAKYYLHLYSGIASYLIANNPEIKHLRLKNLERAKRSFLKATTINNSKRGAKVWYRKNNIHLLKETFAKKQYFAVITHFDQLHARAKKTYQMMYLKALLETKQTTLLKQVLFGNIKLYKKITKHKFFQKDKDKILKYLNFVKSTSELTKNKETSKSTVKKTKKTDLDRAKDIIDSSINNFFSSKNTKSFTWLAKVYAKIKSKQEVNQEESDIIKLVEQKTPLLPPKMLSKLAYTLWKNLLLEDAAIVLEEFIKIHKTHPLLPEVIYNLGRVYEDQQLYAKANDIFSKNCQRLGGTNFEELCYFREAWTKHLHNRETETFKKYLKKYPQGLYSSAANFYNKTSTIDLENIEFEIRKNPISYYSILSLKKHKLPKSLIIESTQQNPKFDKILTRGYKSSPKIQAILRVYNDLKNLGLHEEAWGIFKQLPFNKDNPTLMFSLMKEFQSLEYFTGLTTVGLKAFKNFKDLRQHIGWEAIYPLFMQDFIKQYLAQNDLTVPYFLVISIIRQESAFDKKATSRAKATGLMQLLATTAKAEAKRMGIKHFDLLDPFDNVRIGINHLAILLDKYEGKLEYVLAAYNAGQGTVNRWKAVRGHLKTNEFIESIPYQETRNYVKAVTRNFEMYKMLY